MSVPPRIQVEIYSRPMCKQCGYVKDFCDDMELPYESICLDTTAGARETMMKRIGFSVESLPQIFVNGGYVGGFREFVEWYEENEDKDYTSSQLDSESSQDEVTSGSRLSFEEDF